MLWTSSHAPTQLDTCFCTQTTFPCGVLIRSFRSSVGLNSVSICCQERTTEWIWDEGGRREVEMWWWRNSRPKRGDFITTSEIHLLFIMSHSPACKVWTSKLQDWTAWLHHQGTKLVCPAPNGGLTVVSLQKLQLILNLLCCKRTFHHSVCRLSSLFHSLSPAMKWGLISQRFTTTALIVMLWKRRPLWTLKMSVTTACQVRRKIR